MFLGQDRFGIPEYPDSMFLREGGTSSSSAPPPSPHDAMFEVMAGREPSARMQAGQFMARAGVAAWVTPIPGSIDEAIGAALVIAGVATMVSERFLR